MEDRLLRARAGEHLGLGIDRDAEATPEVAGGGLAQRGGAEGARVLGGLRDARRERLPDEGGGRLLRIAEPEVEQALPAGEEGATALVELDHEVLLELAEDRVLGSVQHGNPEE